MAEKTEEATPKRLRKAREEGDAAVSFVAAQAVAFLVAAALAPAAGRALAVRARLRVREALERASDVAPSASFEPWAFTIDLLAVVSPLLVAVSIAGALAHVVQTNGVLAVRRMAPRFDRIDLVRGLRELVSAPRWLAVARAFACAVLVWWLGYGALCDHLADLAHVGARPEVAAAAAADIAGGLVWKGAWVAAAAGALDLFVVRRAWRRRLRMSKEEVRREIRESEGDPHAKAARERAYRETTAQAMLRDVRHATVVIVNPTHVACALRYDEEAGDAAPRVVASGEGDLARRIVDEARALGVPVVRDVPLARALVELRPGDEIPEALYEAVAEVLRELWEGPERGSEGGGAGERA